MRVSRKFHLASVASVAAIGLLAAAGASQASVIIAVNCGGSTTTSNGVTWLSDQSLFNYVNGTNPTTGATISSGTVTVSATVASNAHVDDGISTNTITTTGITDGAPAAVLPTNDFSSPNTKGGSSGFGFNVSGLTAGDTYQVNLDFADTYATKVGQREFDVAINGTTVLSAFDIYATVGENAGITESYNVAADNNGSIAIALSSIAGKNNPLINAFSIDSVPEPASLGLYCAGAAGLLLLSRRRRFGSGA